MNRRSRRVDSPPQTGLAGLLELIVFRTVADLRGARHRTYLGFAWWFAEPLLFMGVFVLLVDVLHLRSREGLVPFLVTGLVLWQWYQASISNGMSSIMQAKPLLRNIRVDPVIFPCSSVLGDAIKFLFILVVLLVVLWSYGLTPSASYLALLWVLGSLFLLILGISSLIAAIVPFVPDLRLAIAPLLRIQFFVSGIFFEISRVPDHLQRWLALNPLIAYIEAFRRILLDREWPEPTPMIVWSIIGVVLLLIGSSAGRRLGPRYAKLLP